MAQHDFVINNQGFPAFRSDLNDFLNAVRTFHSGTSRPTGAVAGTIFLDTTNAVIPLLKYFDGTDDITLATINHSTNTVTFSGVSTDLVNDLTPQLGGDLDVQTNKVVTTANRNVLVYPNGTGVLEVGGSTNSGRIQLNCEQNTHGIKLASPPHSAGQSYTLTFPTTAPTANKVLQTDGSGNLSFESVSGGISWQSSVKTSNFTAVAGEGYFCNTTSAEFTLTLPATPTAGQQVAVVDYAGTFTTNNLIITSTAKINGSDNDVKLTTNREGTILVYIDSTQGWLAYSGVNEGTSPSLTDSPPPYSVDFLVIAGGGAGGADTAAGGGGAGGYRNSFSTETSGGGGSSETSLTFNAGIVYTVTVGAGGAGATSGGTVSNGNNSSISGSNITTITSTAGGRGANNPNTANSGGSGGGGADNTSYQTAGSGTANQGYAGGNGAGTNSGFNGGGGGGASAVGVAGSGGSGGTAGNGGAGLASSITGSSISRGGGGGGGNYNGTIGSGGTGGGGNGGRGVPESASTSGNANTGGGGGGSAQVPPSGSGGSGVVILRMPTANYSGTTTGSPTVTTDGSDKVIVFNASGSITG